MHQEAILEVHTNIPQHEIGTNRDVPQILQHPRHLCLCIQSIRPRTTRNAVWYTRTMIKCTWGERRNTREPKGTKNNSGGTHKHEKAQDRRWRSESASKRVQKWRRKIREAVEIRTYKPEMKRDNGYNLPGVYKLIYIMYDDILHWHSRASGGGGGGGVLKA